MKIKIGKKQNMGLILLAIALFVGNCYATTPKCENVSADCQDLWWFDSVNSSSCQFKEFCGAYAYLGLRTFENEEDCIAALPATTTTTTCAPTTTYLSVITNCSSNASEVVQGDPIQVYLEGMQGTFSVNVLFELNSMANYTYTGYDDVRVWADLNTSGLLGNYTLRCFIVDTQGNEVFMDDGAFEVMPTTTTTSTTGPTTTTTIPCNYLWWFDNEQNTSCNYNQFCGTYMYLGLRTFETQEACEEALGTNVTTTTTTEETTTTTIESTTTTEETTSTTTEETTTSTGETTTTTTGETTTSTTTSTVTSTTVCEGESCGNETAKEITIHARGQPSEGIFPIMQLWINGGMKAQWNVLGVEKDYVYEPGTKDANGSIDVVYTNGLPSNATNRTLYVYYITVDSERTDSNDSSVYFDRGTGDEAFDGINVSAGLVELNGSGALRFKANATNQTCTMIGDKPPCGEVTLAEVIKIINMWAAHQVALEDVVKLITAYSTD